MNSNTIPSASDMNPAAPSSTSISTRPGISSVTGPDDIVIHDNGCPSIRPPIYIFVVGVIAIWCLFFVWVWELGCALVLYALPVIPLVAWWNHNRSFCTLNHILTQYAHGFVVVFFAVNIVLYLFLFVVGFVVYMITRAIDPSGRLFLFVLAFIYVVIEECFLIYFARRSRVQSDPSEEVTKKHLMASVATSLGYSTSTSLLWTVIVVAGFPHLTVGWYFFITFFLAVIGIPLHVLSGYLVGLEVTKESKFVRVLTIPTIARSIYMWLLIAILLHETDWLAILALVLIVVEFIVFCIYIKKIERTLGFEYLRRVGQLNLFGYGILPDVPEDEMDDDVPPARGVATAIAMDDVTGQDKSDDASGTQIR